MTLISRLEQAEAGSRELDAEIRDLLGLQSDYSADWDMTDQITGKKYSVPVAFSYTTSLDAAFSLVPDGLVFNMGNDVFNWCHIWDDKITYDGRPFSGRGATPALALCAAALKARELS